MSKFCRLAALLLGLDREARVSEHELDVGAGILDEAEIAAGAGELQDDGIDLVEAHRVAPATVGRQRPHTETDDADPGGALVPPAREREAETRGASEVGRRQPA